MVEVEDDCMSAPEALICLPVVIQVRRSKEAALGSAAHQQHLTFPHPDTQTHTGVQHTILGNDI